MKPLYLLLLLLVLTGCRTSKNVDTDKQVDYAGELTVMQHRLDSLLATMQVERKEITDRLSNLKVEHKTVYYSVPDSSGKQYPVIISQTNADKEDKENTESTTELNATISELRTELASLNQRIDSLVKEQQKVAEVSWWNLYKWQVFIFIVILVVVGYMVYKLRK